MSSYTMLPGTDSYEEAVKVLAQEYSTVHNIYGDLEVYCVPDPQRRTVQLIEVSDSFPSTSEQGELWPVRFRPTTDFPFPTAQLIATKDEWVRILNGSLKILADWDLGTLKKVWP